MPNFNGLRGFVSFYAAVSLFLYTWNYLESFYSGDNIEKKIAVKEGLLYLSFAFLLFGTSARRPTFMIPYLAIHLFTIVRSFFEMFHNLYLTFSDEDGYGLSYIRIEEIVGNLLYTMFWFVILKVFLDLMRPSKMVETSYEDEKPEDDEGIFIIEMQNLKKDLAAAKTGGS